MTNQEEYMDGVGTWGTQTLATSGSAVTQETFERVGIRRMLLGIETAIGEVINEQLFEPNDAQTRANIAYGAKEFLSSLQNRKAPIHDFNVVCDETNNTPENVDNHSLNMDIYIQPAPAVEFITLNFRTGRTGADFSTLNEPEKKMNELEAYLDRLGV